MAVAITVALMAVAIAVALMAVAVVTMAVMVAIMATRTTTRKTGKEREIEVIIAYSVCCVMAKQITKQASVQYILEDRRQEKE